MHLTHLSLRNFRNYAQAEVAFSPGTNLIVGNNGQGKTNLLEAIYLVSTGRSFRTRKLSDLIRKGESSFFLEAHFQKEGVDQTLKISYDETARKVVHNSTTYTQFTSLLGILPGVLLSPEDHGLISGSPTERRRFLDIHIAQMNPLYVHHLARYFRAMKQRNHLLRSGSALTLDAWEEMMAHSASYLIQQRLTAVSALQHSLAKWMDQLSLGKEALSVKYASSMSHVETDPIAHLKEQWIKARPREIHIGSTLIGPHRDDLEILISDTEAKDFSSEGQKRCTAAAFRMAEWERFKEHLQTPPLMGIDDFGIQLDGERQQVLAEKMRAFSQVFLTSPHEMAEPTHTIRICQGSLVALV